MTPVSQDVVKGCLAWPASRIWELQAVDSHAEPVLCRGRRRRDQIAVTPQTATVISECVWGL